MNPIVRVIRSLPESYLLNIPQMFHMVILAGFIPWYIGVENYGRLAAVFAIPGFFQSVFEAFCVTILIKYKRINILKFSIINTVLPLIACLSITFFLFLHPIQAILATTMTVFLFCRSFTFAVVISSGSLTRTIAMNEGLIFLCYIAIALLGVHFEIRDITLPLAMISVASAASFWHLLHSIRLNRIMVGDGNKDSNNPLPLNVVIGALTVRAYEDGLLTLSPLLLALTFSTTVAGQFRILVSAIKVVYKLFPFRYEVVMREVGSGRQSFGKLYLACLFYSLASVLIALIVYFFLLNEDSQWLVPIVAASGAVASSLAVYPVSSVRDRRILFTLMVGLLVTYLFSGLLGIFGFVVGFCFTTYIVMVSSLVVIRGVLK